MRATRRAPAGPRPRRRRYRLEPGWSGVALSIVDELADLLPRSGPEDAFAFFEPDPVHRFRPDGTRGCTSTPPPSFPVQNRQEFCPSELNSCCCTKSAGGRQLVEQQCERK